MKNDNELIVVFRATKTGSFKGDVTAVFPGMPEGNGLYGCYAHVGQHSTCSKAWYLTTRRATPDEYADLLAELKSIYEGDSDDEAMTIRVMLKPTWYKGMRRI